MHFNRQLLGVLIASFAFMTISFLWQGDFLSLLFCGPILYGLFWLHWQNDEP